MKFCRPREMGQAGAWKHKKERTPERMAKQVTMRECDTFKQQRSCLVTLKTYIAAISTFSISWYNQTSYFLRFLKFIYSEKRGREEEREEEKHQCVREISTRAGTGDPPATQGCAPARRKPATFHFARGHPTN